MKQTKKWFALLLALAMVFALVGCGGGEAEAEGEAEGLRIVQVSSGAGIDDGSFNQNVYEGIVAFMESRGNIDTFNDVLDSTGDPAAAVQAVADIVADYDVIVTPGFQFAGITSIAQENPDKMFIIVDSFPSDETGAPIELPNVYGMLFTEHEGGFFAGIAAAMSTQTGKVASVHGIAFESNVNYQWGFESGVAYANKHFGTAAEVIELPAYAGTDVTGANVGGNYVGSFADPATGKVIAEALIAQGVDVIFPAGGSSGNGCITAAKEAENVWFIGCDADQYKDGAKGDANICLTSALKVMDINVERQLNAIVDGTFAGANAVLSADTGSTGYVSADGRHQMSAETIQKINEAFAKVKDGTIVPPANFNGLTPDNFTGL
jgi:basic membrane protein A